MEQMLSCSVWGKMCHEVRRRMGLRLVADLHFLIQERLPHGSSHYGLKLVLSDEMVQDTRVYDGAGAGLLGVERDA